MDWIFDNPKGLILVGIVVFSVIKHILEAKKNAEAETPEEREDPFESWNEQPENQPNAYPPPRVRVNIPPPLRAGEPEVEVLLKRQQDMMDRLQRVKDAKMDRAVTSGGAAATRNRMAGSTDEVSKPANTNLRSVLRDRNQTRRAIILREVLGPPLGLR